MSRAPSPVDVKAGGSLRKILHANINGTAADSSGASPIDPLPGLLLLALLEDACIALRRRMRVTN
jgi:hypothetical protein